MAILNRFPAILLHCDLTHFCASRCGIAGDSRPAILGIARFAIRDSVPLSSRGCSPRGLVCPAFEGMALGSFAVVFSAALRLSENTIGCKMITDRFKLFQNYLRAYRYRLGLQIQTLIVWGGINYGLTDTDLAFLDSVTSYWLQACYS